MIDLAKSEKYSVFLLTTQYIELCILVFFIESIQLNLLSTIR